MKINPIVILLIAIVLMVVCIGIAIADTSVPAVPEVQGLTTGTSSNVVGTMTRLIQAHGQQRATLLP